MFQAAVREVFAVAQRKSFSPHTVSMNDSVVHHTVYKYSVNVHSPIGIYVDYQYDGLVFAYWRKKIITQSNNYTSPMLNRTTLSQ